MAAGDSYPKMSDSTCSHLPPHPRCGTPPKQRPRYTPYQVQALPGTSLAQSSPAVGGTRHAIDSRGDTASVAQIGQPIRPSSPQRGAHAKKPLNTSNLPPAENEGRRRAAPPTNVSGKSPGTGLAQSSPAVGGTRHAAARGRTRPQLPKLSSRSVEAPHTGEPTPKSRPVRVTQLSIISAERTVVSCTDRVGAIARCA